MALCMTFCLEVLHGVIIVSNILSKMFSHYSRCHVSSYLLGAQVQWIESLTFKIYFLLYSIKDLILKSIPIWKRFITNPFLTRLEFIFILDSYWNQRYEDWYFVRFLESSCVHAKTQTLLSFYVGQLLLFKETSSVCEDQDLVLWNLVFLVVIESLCFGL